MVSVIVPAYNASSSLERCIHSVMAQTYDSWELIIVNDGSKDDTGLLADTFASMDKRIRVLHKINEGVGAARNDALCLAKGEWITFLDADDYLNPDFLELMLIGEWADIIVGGYHTVGANEIKSIKYSSTFAKTHNQIKSILEQCLTDMTFLCPWGKLFRRSIINSIKLSFCLDMKVGEDVVFVWRYLSHVSSIAIRNTQGYNYYTESSDSKYALDKESSLQTIERIFDTLDRLEKVFTIRTQQAKCHILNYYIWLFKLYVKNNCSLKDLDYVKVFFYNPLIYNYYKQYYRNSKDKLLVYIILKLHVPIALFFLIKIYYR